jgi:hypothetical protein
MLMTWQMHRRAGLVLARDGDVTLDIVGFSRPARWYSRLAAPAAQLVQRRITDRYLSALIDVEDERHGSVPSAAVGVPHSSASGRLMPSGCEFARCVHWGGCKHRRKAL